MNTLPPKVFIYESELEIISSYVKDFPSLETGGDFFGLWTKDGNPVVQFVTGPGLITEQTATHFNQDIEYLKTCGNLLHHKHGIEHIGAWHSHHRHQLNEPSSGDVHTMRNALRGTGFSQFIISICNIDQNDDVAISGFLFSRDKSYQYSLCNWTILDGDSPVRLSFAEDAEAPFLFPKTEEEEISYYVRNADEVEQPLTKQISEKPAFPENSYWTKSEGRLYLKNVFDKMNNRDDLSDVELLQLPDRRIAIGFRHNNSKFEIRFPHDFPKSEADVVEKVQLDTLVRFFKTGRNQKSRMRKFLDSINIFE